MRLAITKLRQYLFKLVVLLESWTRDPFDCTTVAHALANRYATLITSDAHIQENCPRPVWS